MVAYIDLRGPHPKSDNGHVYILTRVDAYTKWAEAFRLQNKDAKTVAKVLVEQLFCRFGTLSDQGREVDGRIMREICQLFDIDKLRTSPCKPSTNQVERLHRTLNTILGKTVEDHQRNWNRRLHCAMAVYRASRHESTGYSPNFLTLGREVRGPVDIVYGVAKERPIKETYDSFVEMIRSRMTDTYSEVRKAFKRNAERNKRYYDGKVRPQKYSVG